MCLWYQGFRLIRCSDQCTARFHHASTACHALFYFCFLGQQPKTPTKCHHRRRGRLSCRFRRSRGRQPPMPSLHQLRRSPASPLPDNPPQAPSQHRILPVLICSGTNSLHVLAPWPHAMGFARTRPGAAVPTTIATRVLPARISTRPPPTTFFRPGYLLRSHLPPLHPPITTPLSSCRLAPSSRSTQRSRAQGPG